MQRLLHFFEQPLIVTHRVWQTAFAESVVAHPHSMRTGVRKESSAKREMLWTKFINDDASSHGWLVSAAWLARLPCHIE